MSQLDFRHSLAHTITQNHTDIRRIFIFQLGPPFCRGLTNGTCRSFSEYKAKYNTWQRNKLIKDELGGNCKTGSTTHKYSN